MKRHEKHDKIVEAAAGRFRYYGIRKTTMQEIAEDAGVAVGTLYLYFSNKDALVAACAEAFAARHQQQADQILSSGLGPEEKLRAYVVARFRQSEETRTASPHAAEITKAVLRVKPDRIREEGAMMLNVIGQVLAEGIEQGVFRTARPEQDVKVFLYSLVAFFPSALIKPTVEPVESDLVEIIDWFLEMWRVTLRAKPKARTAGARSR
jgi:TetR/AcrR family transcriptional regulator, fatty acid metabolism regulator protein